MAARGNLFRSLQDLDAAGSNERKMVRTLSSIYGFQSSDVTSEW
jgi:hypothetical protein